MATTRAKAKRSELNFVTNEAALFLDGSLILAELHIGYEQRLFPHTDVFFTQRLIDRIGSLAKDTGAKQLIINGDVKDTVDGATPEEQRELAAFFKAMALLGLDCVVVKGNHDGDLERFVHDARIVGPGGLLVGDVGIVHGHAWPSDEICQKAKTLVLAHNHPQAVLGGKGAQCWLVGRFGQGAKARFRHWRTMKVILMPAFSRLVGGATVNRAPGAKLLGPLLGKDMFKLDEAEVYTLDGVCVGTVGALAPGV